MLEESTSLKHQLNSESMASFPSAYKIYRYRFIISALYMLSAATNSVMWVCTSPLITTLEESYGLSLFIVNMGTSLIYLIIFIPMSFISNYIIDEMGIRKGILIGNFLTIIGLWVRTFSKDSFFYIFAGQALGAMGAPCILNAPQKISAVWYPPNERTISTTLLSIASPIGVGIGFFIPHLFVPDDAIGADAITDVNHLMFFTAILGTVLLIPSFFLLREKPPTAPSKAASREKLSYKESLKGLVTNKNYLVFLAGASLTWGTYNVLATVLQPLISNFGYSSGESGIYGAITLLMGLIGSPIWGVYVGRTKRYKSSLCILSSLSALVLLALLFIGPQGNYFVTGIFIGLYGFFTTPMLPIMFELCCELTFPVAEANAGGITYMMTQAMGVAGAFIVDAFIGEKTEAASIKAFVVLVVFAFLGVLSFVFTKEELRRARYEQGHLIESPVKDSLSTLIQSQ